jgi:hypothetical protein
MSELQGISQEFKSFAQKVFLDSSPLYESLSLRISEDSELLELASKAVHGPVPNLLFASVHYLLLVDDSHPLAKFFPDISEASAVADSAFPYFREFCLQRAEEISTLLQTRVVQTNEVQRSALLFPAFGLVAEMTNKSPLEMIEIGSAAGLNLLWNKYSYDYGDGTTYGNKDSNVRLQCELRGKERPSLPNELPKVSSVSGIDLNPLDVHNEDDALWLEALVWPEHKKRMKLLRSAIKEARRYRLDIVKGDAIDVLPKILAGSRSPTTCVYSTFTLCQLSKATQQSLRIIMLDSAKEKDLFLVTAEWMGFEKPSELRMTSFRYGVVEDKLLGYCEGHGQWLQWMRQKA